MSRIRKGAQIAVTNLQGKISLNLRKIKQVILGVLNSERPGRPLEVTVCFIDDKAIRELNLLYLGRDTPTDVIAFSMPGPADSARLVADIAVSVDTARRNAKIFRTTTLYELCLYTAHGLLHALGYQDRNTKERKQMQDKADFLLDKLKIGAQKCPSTRLKG